MQFRREAPSARSSKVERSVVNRMRAGASPAERATLLKCCWRHGRLVPDKRRIVSGGELEDMRAMFAGANASVTRRRRSGSIPTARTTACSFTG